METIAGLFGRAVEDAREVAVAEVEVAKHSVLARIARSRTAIVLLVAALILVSAAITAFLVGVVLALAPLVGGVGAGAIVAAATSLVAWLLARSGIARLSAPADAEPRR